MPRLLHCLVRPGITLGSAAGWVASTLGVSSTGLTPFLVPEVHLVNFMYRACAFPRPKVFHSPFRILAPGHSYEFVAHKKKTGKNGPWSLPHSQGRAPPRAVARRYRFGCSRRGWLHPNTRTRWTLHRLEEMMKMMMVPAAPPLLLLPLRPLISNRPAGEEW